MTADPISIATREQARAIKPGLSVWVSASAGSGKTKVLTERVLALLLTGTAPQRILCLTFTKAAAAEMSNRINARLAAWVTLGEDALFAEIAALLPEQTAASDRKAAERLLGRARRLFAEVLDAPGGLQISTLHAFCQSLLRRFPVEARVPPHFALMDERDAQEALERALENTIAHAHAGDDEDLAAALQVITARCRESNFFELMQTLVAARAKLKRMIEDSGGIDKALAAMRARLGLIPGETEAQLLETACHDSAFACDDLRRIVDVMARGTKTDQKRGAGIAAWLAAPALRVTTFEAYTDHFLTIEGVVFERLATKAIVAEVGGVLLAEATRLEALVARVRALRVAEASAALIRIGAHVLDTFELEKIRRGLMDYDDLIQTTRLLLAQPGVADWVLYKLDGGIDHILIDEAQDTNPDQWAIVAPIRDEFFAGAGREDISEKPRTVFAVGDKKQSIYSFQGAAPESFEKERAAVGGKLRAAGIPWDEVEMDVSFRSTDAVLKVVDHTFQSGGSARYGVARDDEQIHHYVARMGQAGLVELWPLIAPAPGDEVASWKPPVERTKGDSPQNRLAAQIAKKIEAMIKGGEMLPSRARRVRAGDIMVLVRRRTGFVEELVRQLKKLDIPVAGVDRMVLTQQIAIMDLVALGQFLLLPDDDLTLAAVLKGPLIGFSEDELFAVAHDRGKQSLWEALTAHAGSASPFGRAYEELAALLAKTDYLTPAGLYAHVLVARGGRRKLLARLGIDADDPIDEFMNLALAYQNTHAPSLQGFLHWLAAGDTEIKRDLEQSGGDAVRVITVHGAKGLQAPIVFMPDTAQAPTLRDALLWTDEAAPLLYWAAKADELDPATASLRDLAKQAQEREYHRLLYVAMTRAEDRLYVCGWQGKRSSRPDSTWYGFVAEGLKGLGAEKDGEILRVTSPQTAPPKPDRTSDALQTAAPIPTWVSKPAPAEASPPRPLAPSRAIADPAALSPLKDDGKHRYQRGIIIHRLLQSLPDLPPARRRAAAEAFAKRPAWGLAPETMEAIVAETLRVLDDPAFAPLFAPGSRAEVSLAGLVGKHVISAQVDRLAVTATDVWLIDYKTNRPPPREAAKVDPAYLLQMATYRAALTAIYPQHRIRCVLLWTDGPFTMELEAAAMDAALIHAGLI